MESYQFPSTYTAISGLLDDVDNSKQWNFELWHYCTKATIYIIYIYIYISFIYIYHLCIYISLFFYHFYHFTIFTSFFTRQSGKISNVASKNKIKKRRKKDNLCRSVQFLVHWEFHFSPFSEIPCHVLHDCGCMGIGTHFMFTYYFPPTAIFHFLGSFSQQGPWFLSCQLRFFFLLFWFLSIVKYMGGGGVPPLHCLVWRSRLFENILRL